MDRKTAVRDPLIGRFSLYGFLKNQQYYEPFFLLALRAKGLTYFQIGLLHGFREVCVNAMGIPAGFLADLRGRRASLLVCFLAYILAFLGFGLLTSFPGLLLSMFALAVGESFRSGTHKAMVFHHLRLTGRESEKARIYGSTRSWSKAGSAASSLISGLLVLVTGNWSRVFLFAIPPYLLNMANVGTYPAVLEGEARQRRLSVRGVLAAMVRETGASLSNGGARRLFLQSAMLQAVGKSVKDYMQPLALAALAGWAVSGPFRELDSVRRSAVLLGVLYFALNLGAAWASRSAHRFDRLERSTIPWLWSAVALAGALVAVGSGGAGAPNRATLVAVLGFVLLVLVENTWRPLFLDRLDEVSDPAYGAAVLSVEAQFASLGVMVCAPLAGCVADRFGLEGIGVLVVVLAAGTGIAMAFGDVRARKS